MNKKCPVCGNLLYTYWERYTCDHPELGNFFVECTKCDYKHDEIFNTPPLPYDNAVKITHTPTGTVITEGSSISKCVNLEHAHKKLEIIVPGCKREDILVETFRLATNQATKTIDKIIHEEKM